MSNHVKKLPADCRIRQAHELDTEFIIDTWLITYYKQNPILRRFKVYDMYEAEQKATIHKYLSNGAKILIAHNPKDSNERYGYLVYHDIEGVLIAHYLFVRGGMLYQEIGKSLLRAAGFNLYDEILVTHITRMCIKLADKYQGKKYKIILVDKLADTLINKWQSLNQ